MDAKNSKTNVLRIAIAGVLLSAQGVAHSSGFALLEQSGSRMGSAFSGTAAAADDATTIFFNPAGLTFVERPQAIVIASGVALSSEFQNRGSLPALGQPLGGDGGDAGDFAVVPSAYASLPLSERMAIGIGVNVPFGLKTEYDDGWIGRFQALKSEIQTINVNPTLAFRINDAVSIGVGVNYQTLDAELTNSVNYTAVIAQALQQQAALDPQLLPALPGLIAANAGLEGHARVKGDDDAWGYNIGVMFSLGERTRIGLSYRSSLDYKVTGSARFIPPNATEPLGSAIIAGARAPGGPLADGPVFVDLELPDSALLSLRQRIGTRFELLADIGWTGWSSVQELRVVRRSGTTLSLTPEHWNDAWRFALGGTYEYSPTWKFRAGLAYDGSAVPDSTRTPRLPDVERKWVAIGAQWKASESIALDFGYAHLFSSDAPLDQNDGNTAAAGRLLGKQESSVDVLSVQLTYSY